MKKHLRLMTLLLPTLLFIFSSKVFASEGEAFLSNQEGTNARCKAYSVLMTSMNYEILMTCRDITYPGDANQFFYVTWAEPTNGGNVERLGTLGVGKVQYDTNKAFRRLFVTREVSSTPRTPSQKVVMAGNISSPQEFVNETYQPTQTQSPSLPSPTSTPTSQTSGNLISRLLSPGRIVLFVGVILLLGLVFILTRR